MWWQQDKFRERQPYLERRMALIKAVRAYFDDRGFMEVETPILQVSPVMDTHIHAMKTDIRGVDLQYEKTRYLHTSPEFAMKKLLVAGVPKIYQVCHVFRDAEGSRLHSPEFTMLEWYRASERGYLDMMEDCIGLLGHCARELGIREYRYRGKAADPFAEWQILTVADAFREYAGIELERHLEHIGPFRTAIASLGLHTSDTDRWDDLFFRVMGEKIEPHLGMGVPTILCDYPASMASLSRKKPDDPRYAERFEMYVCGIELCNAFGELTDAAEQRKRFHEEMEMKQKMYGERYPVDEDFIAALEHGLPESGGNALGVDRLAMLATDADDIRQVLWTDGI